MLLPYIPLQNFRITKAIYSVSYLYSSHLLITAENVEMLIILCLLMPGILCHTERAELCSLRCWQHCLAASTRQMFSKTAIKNSSLHININCRQNRRRITTQNTLFCVTNCARVRRTVLVQKVCRLPQFCATPQSYLFIIFTKTPTMEYIMRHTNLSQNCTLHSVSWAQTPPVLPKSYFPKRPGTSRILWHSDLNYAHGHLWMYTQWSLDEIQTPKHRNLIGRRVTAPPPVIAQQYSSTYFIHCAFILARTISACAWRTSLFDFVVFF
jgi:hypothetical protein